MRRIANPVSRFFAAPRVRISLSPLYSQKPDEKKHEAPRDGLHGIRKFRKAKTPLAQGESKRSKEGEPRVPTLSLSHLPFFRHIPAGFFRIRVMLLGCCN